MKTPSQCMVVYTHAKACTSINAVSTHTDTHTHGHTHVFMSAYNSWTHVYPCAHTQTHISTHTHTHTHSSTQSDLGKSNRTHSHRMIILSGKWPCAHTPPSMPRPWTGLGEVGL